MVRKLAEGQLNLFDLQEIRPPTVEPVHSVYTKGKLYQLDLATLIPDPDQPRKYFDEQALAELRGSIASHGVLQPILVRCGPEERLFIVSGERRFLASKAVGLKTIPAIITDGEPAEIAIIENLLRENLTAIEEAEAIERLRRLHDYGLAQLVTVLGKAESTLSEILSLNRLPAEVKDDCRNNPRAMRSILTLIARQKRPEKMLGLYAKYKESGLTYGELRKQTARKKSGDAPVDLAFVDRFSERLDTLDVTGLTEEQKSILASSLGTLRSVVSRWMKALK